MTNPYYNHGSYPATRAQGNSASMRAELDAVTTGFGLLPAFAGNTLKLWRINAGETGVEAVDLATVLAGLTSLTINGTLSGVTDLTTTGNTVLGNAVGDTLNVAGGSLQINASGNAGLGSAAGSNKLRVYVAAGQSRAEVAADAGQTAALAVTGNGNAVGATSLDLVQDGAGVGYLFQRANQPLVLGTNNTNRLQISAGGDITTLNAANPNNRHLLLAGKTYEELVLKSTSASGVAGQAVLYFGNAAIDTIGWVNYDIASNFLNFGVNGGERMRLASDGSARFGDPGAPTAAVDIVRAQNNATIAQVRNETAGNASYAMQRVVSDWGSVSMVAFSSTYTGNASQGWLYTTGINSLILGTAGANRVEIGGTGLVGVGKTAATYALEVNGDVQATNFRGALVGNASTATSATTAAAVANALTAGSYLTAAGVFDGSAARTFAVDATAVNTASKVVARDASGNFAAATITAALSGNAATATALQTPRNINGVAFDGSANITVPAAAGTLTGATLAAGVTGSSLTSVGANCTDGTNELGYKGLPAASVTTGAFAASDRGKCIYATAGVTIPNATMAAGDVVVIQNTTGGAITITKTITTAYNCNSGAALGATFTLGARGRCAILFESGTVCDVSGNIS